MAESPAAVGSAPSCAPSQKHSLLRSTQSSRDPVALLRGKKAAFVWISLVACDAGGAFLLPGEIAPRLIFMGGHSRQPTSARMPQPLGQTIILQGMQEARTPVLSSVITGYEGKPAGKPPPWEPGSGLRNPQQPFSLSVKVKSDPKSSLAQCALPRGSAFFVSDRQVSQSHWIIHKTICS